MTAGTRVRLAQPPQPRDPARIALGQQDVASGRAEQAVCAVQHRPAAAEPLAAARVPEPPFEAEAVIA